MSELAREQSRHPGSPSSRSSLRVTRSDGVSIGVLRREDAEQALESSAKA